MLLIANDSEVSGLITAIWENKNCIRLFFANATSIDCGIAKTVKVINFIESNIYKLWKRNLNTLTNESLRKAHENSTKF